jgi:hypothetical protein
MIACLGWGSLIWRPESLQLPNCNDWRDDGPELPIEFARQSNNGRLTLVIDPQSPLVRVLWSPMSVTEMSGAIESLRTREEMPTNGRIGRWPNGDGFEFSDAISAWARARNIDGVVWTALGPQFAGAPGRRPTQTEVIEYLQSLSGETLALAEEYIRRAPSQIDTPYRRAIIDALGWTPDT